MCKLTGTRTLIRILTEFRFDSIPGRILHIYIKLDSCAVWALRMRVWQDFES